MGGNMDPSNKLDSKPFGLDPIVDPPPEQQGTAAPQPNKKRRALIAAAIAAPLLIAGLGYYGWTTRADLAAASSENRSLSDALELHRTSSEDLGGKLETCTGELEAGKTTIQETDVRVATLEANLVAARTQVVDLRKQKAEAKARLAEFRAVTRSFQSMINTGKLEVIFRKGQMIVKLPARVLFRSGSAEISAAGVEALGEVAAILKKMRGRKFTVAGHTDNVAISTEEFRSNWELSSGRAVAVLQLLISRGVPPARLVAAGFGPHAPIATNATPRGRQLNRRIEIILEPYLRKPPELAKKTARKNK